MLKEDYEASLTTLNQPFEIGIPNKHSRLRLDEIDLKTLETDQLYPHRQVIRFNSTYLEVIDSWEFVRGRATALALPMWAALAFGVFLSYYFVYDLFFKKEYIFLLIFLFFNLILTFLIYINYKMCRYDLFGYTHYPIRFNRKTQKVYAFSPQRRKIIELNWNELRFSAVREGYEIELRASKVNQDNIVEEEIIFPFRTPRYEYKLVEQHLAFFKAYMESDDLKKIDKSIPEFFDIYNRKESFKETFERIYMKFDEDELVQETRPNSKDDIISISAVAIGIYGSLVLRRLGLRFSKIPQWPAHIENECRIEKNDPYDSTNKKRHLAPLVFSVKEKLILFTGLILGSSIFNLFLGALAYTRLNAE